MMRTAWCLAWLGFAACNCGVSVPNVDGGSGGAGGSTASGGGTAATGGGTGATGGSANGGGSASSGGGTSATGGGAGAVGGGGGTSASGGGGVTVTDGGDCSDFSATKNLYWGDLHTHTAYSVDAYAFGTRNNPVDAYQFARGAPKQVGAGIFDGGGPVTQLAAGRTLDFDAITDHSEWLATTYGCGVYPDGGPFFDPSPLFTTQTCQFVRTPAFTFSVAFDQQTALCGTGGTEQSSADCLSVTKSAWADEQAAAAAANDRCHFTSLVAYEWTYARMGATLHRNVIFATDTVPDAPYDSLDYDTPPLLFAALNTGCVNDAGCRALVIPHNTNLSTGLAFEITSLTHANLANYNRYEKLIEMHQHKGDSECFYDYADGGYGSDPSCDFEHLAKGNDADDPQSYVRSGLLTGLVHYEDAGVNPFQFGIEAATDDHNGVPGNVAEDTWPGHAGINDDTPARRLAPGKNNPGGITGVWAEQNTREAIYAALDRRETIGTSGPRIPLRFYQTWDTSNFCTGGFPANVLAAGGVPMGSNLTLSTVTDAGPSFVASALKDTDDLAELDIIKLSVKSGVRTVNVTRFPATSGGSICVDWQDPAFDPTAPAAYYVRVLQVPTWRWSHYDCAAITGTRPAGCSPDGGFDVQIQERAWSSPIFSLQ